MGRLNLYRELKMDELNKCIQTSTLKVAYFINDVTSEKQFLQFLADKEHEKAISVAKEIISIDYVHLVHYLEAYLKAKAMMEKGEIIYTDLVNTDTTL